VKDSMWQEGIRAPMGSRAFEGFVAPETAVALQRLETAGAVIFARTTTSELCRGFETNTALYSRTNNPWDLDRSVGASSGGAAAAVAAGLGPLAIGSD